MLLIPLSSKLSAPKRVPLVISSNTRGTSIRAIVVNQRQRRSTAFLLKESHRRIEIILFSTITIPLTSAIIVIIATKYSRRRSRTSTKLVKKEFVDDEDDDLDKFREYT